MALVGFSDSTGLAGFSSSSNSLTMLQSQQLQQQQQHHQQQQQVVKTSEGSPALRVNSSSSTCTTQPLAMPAIKLSAYTTGMQGLPSVFDQACCPLEPLVGVPVSASLTSTQVQQQLLQPGTAVASGAAAEVPVSSGLSAAVLSMQQPGQQQQQVAAGAEPGSIASKPGHAAAPVTQARGGLAPSPHSRQQQQEGEVRNASGNWVRDMAAEWAHSPSLCDLPPGFGPMSLSPATAAAEAAGLQAAAAGACSMSDAELAAFLDDTVDLDDLLSKHANWVLEMS